MTGPHLDKDVEIAHELCELRELAVYSFSLRLACRTLS